MPEPGGQRGATVPPPPIFCRSVNPIRTGEGRLSPPITTAPRPPMFFTFRHHCGYRISQNVIFGPQCSLIALFRGVATRGEEGVPGEARAPPEFGGSVNPIQTTRGGADYAQHIIASPPRFKKQSRSLLSRPELCTLVIPEEETLIVDKSVTSRSKCRHWKFYNFFYFFF